MGINQVFNLVCWSKAKEGRTPLLNANNLTGKDPAVGINGFEGVRSEWLMPKRNPCCVLEESRIWRGREGNWPSSACPLHYLSFFLNFLSSVFLFFLLFSFALFSFYSVNTLCFSILFSGHGKSSFIVPTVTSFLPFCPLTAFIWSGVLADHQRVRLRATHPCQTKACLFHLSVYRSTPTCHGINALSLYSQGMHLAVPPSTLPLLGGLSSQQDVPPKRTWAGTSK